MSLISSLTHSLSAWIGLAAEPEAPVRYVEPSPFVANLDLESAEDVHNLAAAANLGGPTRIQRLNLCFFSYGNEVESPQIGNFQRDIGELRGSPASRQDVADYLLKCAVQIDAIAKRALRRLDRFGRQHPDEIAAGRLRFIKMGFERQRRDIARSIPRFAATLTPVQENGQTDWKYIQDRYSRVPTLEQTIPNIYRIPLETLQAAASKPPTGLVNRGANCWAISLLQLFINVPHFRDNLFDNLPEEFRGMRELAAQYLLDQAQGKPHSIIDSTGLRILLNRELGIVHERIDVNEDAHEAFTAITSMIESFEVPDGESFNPAVHRPVNSLAMAIGHKKRYNFPEGLRPVEYEEDGSRTRWEPDVKFDSPMPERTHAFFEDILEKNVFDNPYAPLIDDPFQVDGIRLQPQEDSIKLYEPPQQLTVALRRFRYDTTLGRRLKVHTKVDIPIHYTLSDDKTSRGQAASYHLQGFIIHIGNGHGGHYISCIRKGDSWFLCNDARIEKIRPRRGRSVEDQVRSYASDAYLLTFEKTEEITAEAAAERTAARMREKIPLEALHTHNRLPKKTQADMLIGLTEQFLDDPSEDNFDRLPTTIKNELAFIKWIEDGKPDVLEYGMQAIRRDPRSLLEIRSPYFSMHGNNVIQQLWYRNVFLKDREKKAIDEEGDIYQNWLERRAPDGNPLFSDDELRHLQGLLSQQTRNMFAHMAWEAIGKKQGDRIGEKELRKNPRLLSKTTPSGRTYLAKAKEKLLASR